MIVYACAVVTDTLIRTVNDNSLATRISVEPCYKLAEATRMAHSSVLGLFDPKNEWIDDYKERFDFYCVAHGVEENKQKALFLTSIGQQMYAKLKTWIRPST